MSARGLPKIAKSTKIQKMCFFLSSDRPEFDHWDGKIDSEHPLKKMKDSVLKFPRPVDIFEPKLFWKWGGQSFFGRPLEE